LAFDRRVQNWESKYFLNVVRANDSDPSYDNIRLKWFKPEVLIPSTGNKEDLLRKKKGKGVKVETKIISKDIEDTLKEGLTPNKVMETVSTQIVGSKSFDIVDLTQQKDSEDHSSSGVQTGKKTKKKSSTKKKPSEPISIPDKLENLHNSVKVASKNASNAGGNTNWQNAGYIKDEGQSEIVLNSGDSFTFGS